MSAEGDLLHIVTADNISEQRKLFGKLIVWGSAALLFLVAFVQTADQNGWISIGFETWRPTLYAYILWAICLCAGQVIARGEHGKRTLFVLPATLFVVSMVVFHYYLGWSSPFRIGTLPRPMAGNSMGGTTFARCGRIHSIGMRCGT